MRSITRLATAGLLGASLSAAGAEDHVVPSEWYSTGSGTASKFGIVFEANDLHPHFLYGDCVPPNPSEWRHEPLARLNLEISEKVVGKIIMNGGYLVARFQGDGEAMDLTAEGIILNEAGDALWTPQFKSLRREDMEYIGRSRSMSLQFGSRHEGRFMVETTYKLPDRNRAEAISAFVKQCFSEASNLVPRKPAPPQR